MDKLDLKAGDRIKIFYNVNNINNKTIQIRSIVDKTKIVSRVWSRRKKMWIYTLEDVSHFEYLYEKGKLVKIL